MNPGLKSWSSNSPLGNRRTRISSNPSSERGRRITCRLLPSTVTLLPSIFLRSARPASPVPYIRLGADPYLKNQSPLILCVINGDENVFPKSLFIQGQTGGRQAAQSLTKSIAEYLANEDLQVLGRLSFWITIYYNKRNLLDLLLDNDLCTAEQFEAFLSGFSETSPRFTMVDVGFSKGATVAKVIGADPLHLVSPLPLGYFETALL